ncbi:DUF4183 domain-containing protein [Bacillus sp. C30]|uniref:DUF4183 domain-containing protein n=1 Tax=Bacillus sp. C30 TaxID=1387733 RepID=UPI00349FCF19
MALQLMKHAISAETTIDIVPTDTKFFHVTTNQIDAGTTVTIPATQFFQSDGSPATVFPDFTNYSIFKVYINGILQMQDIFTIFSQFTPPDIVDWSLIIHVPAGAPILKGTPIVLEFVEFTPSSTTTLTS